MRGNHATAQQDESHPLKDTIAPGSHDLRPQIIESRDPESAGTNYTFDEFDFGSHMFV